MEARPDRETSTPERRRFLDAIVPLIAQRGYLETDLELLLKAGGLEKADFHRNFADLDHCFAAAWQEIDDELYARTSAAYAVEEGWSDQMRAGLGAGLQFLAEDSDRARFYVIDAAIAGGPVQQLREQAIARFEAAIAVGNRSAAPSGLKVRALAEGLAGGIWHRTAALIREGRSEALPAELPRLMYFLLLPFFGVEAAESELRRPPPS